MNYFITGIGTGIGKTLVSAILTEALEADYWKPIQAGNLEQSDTEIVKSLVSNKKSKFYPEAFRLTNAMSPHAAAAKDGIEIKLADFKIPETTNNLIIEGAGGLMVPLNSKGDLIIDLIQQLKSKVILVSQHYLGSINHTLLSVEALKTRNIPIAGMVFNGEDKLQSEEFILKYSGVNCLLRIQEEKSINKQTVLNYNSSVKFLQPFIGACFRN